MADLIESLIGIPGAVAVARAGGEDAARPAPPRGKPAYLLYYRGRLDAGDLGNLGWEGEVSKPGAWSRLMNGGASLTVEGRRVDVVYRDLDAVEHWVAEASEGRFEIDPVEGWVAGMPSYVLVGELATCEALAGELPQPAAGREGRPDRDRPRGRRHRPRRRHQPLLRARQEVGRLRLTPCRPGELWASAAAGPEHFQACLTPSRSSTRG